MTDRLEQLHKLHAVDPADSDLSYMIALEHMKAEAFNDALHWLDEALKQNDTYLYAYYQKAKALSQLGKDDDAKQAITLGLKKANEVGDAKAVSELGELMAALG